MINYPSNPHLLPPFPTTYRCNESICLYRMSRNVSISLSFSLRFLWLRFKLPALAVDSVCDCRDTALPCRLSAGSFVSTWKTWKQLNVDRKNRVTPQISPCTTAGLQSNSPGPLSSRTSNTTRYYWWTHRSAIRRIHGPGKKQGNAIRRWGEECSLHRLWFWLEVNWESLAAQINNISYLLSSSTPSVSCINNLYKYSHPTHAVPTYGWWFMPLEALWVIKINWNENGDGVCLSWKLR